MSCEKKRERENGNRQKRGEKKVRNDSADVSRTHTVDVERIDENK